MKKKKNKSMLICKRIADGLGKDLDCGKCGCTVPHFQNPFCITKDSDFYNKFVKGNPLHEADNCICIPLPLEYLMRKIIEEEEK